MRVSYDYLASRAVATGVTGYEGNRTYIRLYDRKQEYLLWRGVWSGGAIGVVMGGVGALAVVDPGDHGFSSVFLSGVRGRSLFSMLRWPR